MLAPSHTHTHASQILTNGPVLGSVGYAALWCGFAVMAVASAYFVRATAYTAHSAASRAYYSLVSRGVAHSDVGGARCGMP